MTQAISDSHAIDVNYDVIDDSDDFAYKSLSRAGVLSLVFGLFGLLAWISPLLLFLPAIGFVFGLVALRNLKK